MKRTIKMTVAALLLAGSLAYAEARGVPLPAMVEKSDLIGQVEVLSTTEIVPSSVEPETGAAKERPIKEGEYRSQAEVKVIYSIKGLKAGETYILEFDNGYACPNVWYQKGEQCLVFNTKMKNGHYGTPNTYLGKYTMKENGVVDWKKHSNQTTPFNEVADEIATLMQAPMPPKSRQ